MDKEIKTKLLSELMENTPETIRNWKKQNKLIIQLFNKYFDDEDIIEFLDKGKISKFENKLKEKNDEIRDLFFKTYDEAKEIGNEVKLKAVIENFNLMKSIEMKFRDMYNEEKFFSYILNGYSNKISNVILLAKILKESKIKPNLETAKEYLLNLLDNYELKLMEDRVTHLLTNKKKNILKLWVEEELDDIACYIILSNIPEVMEILEKHVNPLNKEILKKMNKEVKEEK